MSQPLLDFGNQANWLLVYEERRDAAYLDEQQFTPLPAFELPFLFDKPILACKAFSQGAKPTWRFAGTLTQRFQLGSGGVGTTLPIAEASRRGLKLGRTELCVFTQYTQHYELLLECPYWLDNLRLTIWEYVGPNSDSTEALLELARIDLFRMESKIDSLTSSGG